MPELPEVQTVADTLRPLIAGEKIIKVQVLYGKIIENVPPEVFAENLVGEVFLDISRRGKFLIFKTTHFDLISHLRMEGKYEVVKKNAPLKKHTHVCFTFASGFELRYLDVRKFGRMVLLEKDTALTYKSLQKLGPEPTPQDFLLPAFQEALKKSHKEIKPLLLEQKVVVGLGNIYVDEALWESKIHPLRRSDSLSPLEVTLLHQKIMEVLEKALKKGGTTIRSYHNAIGETGLFQIELKVYGKEGTPCLRCGTLIEKIRVGGRGTHFCPTCQKLEE